jgi:hypothetical protein
MLMFAPTAQKHWLVKLLEAQWASTVWHQIAPTVTAFLLLSAYSADCQRHLTIL